MGLRYHEGMEVPYEATGRTDQKGRTRAALVAAIREQLAEGSTPTVEEAAARSGISRTTAYRYFPNQRALLLAAHPQIEYDSLLADDAPTDVEARLDQVMRAFTAITTDWEAQLRTSLRLSLELSPGQPGGEQPVLRQGRAIGWIADALAPLRASHPHIDTRRLAIAIRSATGIEAMVWLTDIAGLSRAEAVELMCSSARALLRAALDQDTP